MDDSSTDSQKRWSQTERERLIRRRSPEIGVAAVQSMARTHPQFVLGVLSYWSRESE